MKGSRPWHNIHDEFKLNGIHFAFDELNEIGYSLIKEGEDFEKAIGDFLLDWISDSDTVSVKTSGSTGDPKNILLQKVHMMNSALATGTYFSLSPSDNALLCLPFSGIAGKMMLVRAMVLGLSLDYVRPSSQPLQGISKSYDFVAMVPLQVEKSLEQLTQVKTLIIGGAPVPLPLKKQMKEVSAQVFETYGMTETITHIAVMPLNGRNAEAFSILPDIKISKDERDCLVIEAPKITDSVVVTNDIVELISETKFNWIGRYDSVINSGGIKLYPEKIEEKLSAVIRQRFFLSKKPHEELGEQLVLVVEGKSTSSFEFLEKIKKTGNLGKFEIPKEILFVSEFVETESGKINRLKTAALAGLN